MHCANRPKFLLPWFGVCFGLMICLLPIVAVAVEFKPPRRGIPGRREGAGTRGPACTQGAIPLTTLLPQTNVGLTTAAYPQFFWFVPKTRAKAMQFMLFRGDEQEPEQELMYETTLNIPANPGIVTHSLPQDAKLPPLRVGQDYFWIVTLLCNPTDPVNNLQATGWVQRVDVEPSLANQLSKASLSDRVALYAENGLWFDTVSTLASLRCSRPKDSSLTQSWGQLMNSVKLDKLANQPLIERCDAVREFR